MNGLGSFIEISLKKKIVCLIVLSQMKLSHEVIFLLWTSYLTIKVSFVSHEMSNLVLILKSTLK